jgi:trans-aconitate 2-methyltransferase
VRNTVAGCYHAAGVTTWEPRTYLRYADVRFRAGLDLIARIPANEYRTIYDLGCGTGYLTHVLAEKFPQAQVVGIDKSPEMLAKAKEQIPQPRRRVRDAKGAPDDSAERARGILRPEPQDDGAEERSKITWVQGDILSWRPRAPADLIFSNAALQWVPNHKTLMRALLEALRPGGVLAVQMPQHFASPSHIELKKLVQQPRWRSRLAHLQLKPIPAAEEYWQWLSPKSAHFDLWETIYLLVLDGKDPVVNFMAGTALRPFLTVLSEREGKQLIAAFAKRMSVAYPAESTGQTLFPFRRLFFIAQR